jgi:sucrose-6-phosphate hydrolase SacC (GH32 family)
VLFGDAKGKGLELWHEDGAIFLDRRERTKGRLPATAFHNRAKTDCQLVDGKVVLRILLDRWSCEVFVAGGRRTLTATVRPDPDQGGLSFFSDLPVSFSVEAFDIAL